MSIFFNQFYKNLVIFAFVYFSSGCLYPAHNNDAFAELQRGSSIAAFEWQKKPNSNIVILDNANQHVATIFTLRYQPDRGKIGVYLNNSDGTKESKWPFKDHLTAKEWIIERARNLGIVLAR